MTEQDECHWYVLRCSYGKELLLQDSVRKCFDVDCFVPVEKIRQRGAKGRFVWIRRCALTGYLFVRTDRETLNCIVKRIPSTFVMMMRKEELYRPVIVPDRDMANFIRVSGSEEEQVVFLDPAKLDLKRGDKVRVMGGTFVGAEGYFLQIGNKHEKRVVIQLVDFIAVATAAIPASLVEKIDD